MSARRWLSVLREEPAADLSRPTNRIPWSVSTSANARKAVLKEMVHAIGDNEPTAARPETVFTPERATATLPLVRQIVSDLTRLSRSTAGLREQLRGLEKIAGFSERAEFSDELADIHGALAADEIGLQTYLQELAAIGVEPHLPFDGSVDFPAELNRRPIRLCWHPADEKVGYWHEFGQPRSSRLRLESRSTSARAGER